MPTPEEKMMDLKQHLIYWQRQLRLDDVDIKLRWRIPEEEEDKNDSLGCIDTDDMRHEVSISLLHPSIPSPYAGFYVYLLDTEITLVHELLHLCFSGWVNDKKTDIFLEHTLVHAHYERSIEAIAEALVRARRGITR